MLVPIVGHIDLSRKAAPVSGLPSCGSGAPHGCMVSGGRLASPAAAMRGCFSFFGQCRDFLFSFGLLWVRCVSCESAFLFLSGTS